jgi:hypothetical protein
MSPSNTASVAVRPTLHLVGRQLSAADLLAVSEWIRRNEAVIVGYWDGTIDTGVLVLVLRPWRRRPSREASRERNRAPQRHRRPIVPDDQSLSGNNRAAGGGLGRSELWRAARCPR